MDNNNNNNNVFVYLFSNGVTQTLLLAVKSQEKVIKCHNIGWDESHRKSHIIHVSKFLSL